MDQRILIFAGKKHSLWIGRTVTDFKSVSQESSLEGSFVENAVRICQKTIEAYYPTVALEQGLEKNPLTVYKYAKRISSTDTGQQCGTPNGHNVITSGNVVQAYVEQALTTSRIVRTQNSHSMLCFFAIIAVLQRSREHPWAIVLKCSVDGEATCLEPGGCFKASISPNLSLRKKGSRIPCLPRGWRPSKQVRCRCPKKAGLTLPVIV